MRMQVAPEQGIALRFAVYNFPQLIVGMIMCWQMGKFTILCGSCGTPGMPSLSSTGAPLIRVLFIFLIVRSPPILGIRLPLRVD